jgi:hypothetical protein
VTAHTALTYGNTLTWESQKEIAAATTHKRGWTIVHHSFPNTGLCTWNTWLAADLARYQPAVVGVASMSNPFDATNPSCGVDASGTPLVFGSQAYLDSWRTELIRFFTTVTASGAQAVYFSPLPVKDPTRNAVLLQQDAIARAVAASMPRVSVSAALRTALSKAAKYTDTKPCLSTETAAQGCANGLIAIRTLTAPIQAGNHLCPGGLPDAYPWFCTTYSSGEFRFARALVNTLVRPPPPLLP